MPRFCQLILLSVCTLYLVQQATSFTPVYSKCATTLSYSGKNPPIKLDSPSLASRHSNPLMMSSEEQQNDADSWTCSFVVTTTAVFGILSSLTLLWSEASIVLTKCGPMLLPDFLERSAYISAFIIASGTNLSKTILSDNKNILYISKYSK